ncbi:isochorismatase family protein [Synoicihabitans lomoniglobus]|uniref:Isochorismatase family protein n=1 Tax=Synoicihabitans lomoniglobus TaxID=2909285 RepID=A0AAF0CRX9_9BACT|nr:cysteine hydrolase [Opitutaceae bacterium LMO-M01]WED66983.1 isochorismatase family protein [Opitutaceae bacterium LMO-M01]
MSVRFRCPVSSYHQFDGPHDSAWHRPTLEFSAAHTAVVVMHAWTPPAPGTLPGWVHAVPYLTTTRHILRDVFPPLLTTVRAAGLAVYHVSGCTPPPAKEPAVPDETWNALTAYRAREVFPGAANQADVAIGLANRSLAPEAAPREGEPVVEDADALHAACRERGINHLIYIGFAINWCLLMSPAGMVDMRRRGYLCSTIAEATTAVESRESAAHNDEYRQALWRVAVEFGFVFKLKNFTAALTSLSSSPTLTPPSS